MWTQHQAEIKNLFQNPKSKVLPNDRYVIKDIENCQITQLPYDGIIEARHMRKWVGPGDNLFEEEWSQTSDSE